MYLCIDKQSGMNQRFTYSIPTHALSFPATASHICVSEPRPTFLSHPVQPLKGLRSPRAASVSYRALAPYGTNRPFGIEGCQTVLPQSILNSEFLILNWTYTFSAKERDSETGLSYFGSRYYSSDLSVWLSVDPMASKYPSLSPYVYCADNLVKLVDPNGEEIGDKYNIFGVHIGFDGKADGKVYLYNTWCSEQLSSTEAAVLTSSPRADVVDVTEQYGLSNYELNLRQRLTSTVFLR
jgi:RHS repeat-associated protein